MKKYLLLLSLPIVLVGCNENNDQAFLQPNEELIDEADQTSVADSTNEDEQSSDQDAEDNHQEETPDQAPDKVSDSSDGEDEADGENTTSVTQTGTDSSTGVANTNRASQGAEAASNKDNSSASSQSGSSQPSPTQVSTGAVNDVEKEEAALKAVDDYVDYELENYIYLIHQEENGEWVQVEVREQMPNQDQTNLVDLYRYNSETGELEAFDFIEGTYLPID